MFWTRTQTDTSLRTRAVCVLRGSIIWASAAFKGSIWSAASKLDGVGWQVATDSFSPSPMAHYTSSNNNVIYYLHGSIPTTSHLESLLKHTYEWAVMLCCGV